MIRLVATDLDLTVVRPDGTISRRVREAFAACRSAGMLLCVATGRVRQGVVQLGQDYTICHGGTLVLQGEETIARTALSAADAQALWRWAADAGVRAVFYGEHAWSANYADERIAALARFIGTEPEGEPGWDVPLARLQTPAGPLAAAFPGLHVEEEGAWSYVRKAPADKGTALRTLMDRLGLQPQEVICFGDELNDLPMFAVAGHAVAVGNAREELKAAATRIAPPVEEDGVALVLEELLAEVRRMPRGVHPHL
jgi:HAD superfamily hydrolase (TIGR01484 family)